MPDHHVVLLSGGLDSTAAASLLARAHDPAHIHPVAVDYGQRHRKELDAAAAVANALNLAPLTTLDLTGYGQSVTSALTDPSIDVPDGEYTPETASATVVPGRNAVFIMAAAGLADTIGASTVTIATHAGDHYLYPDCRPEFITAATATVHAATDGRVTLNAPFVDHTKAQIVTVGREAGAPFGLTWSCYRGEDVHCGGCGTCTERREAFATAGAPDPTTYA